MAIRQVLRNSVRPLVPAAAVVLFAALTGCGGVKMYPVSGNVTLNGQAVAGAAVMYHPVAGGAVASAVTDADGNYQLGTTNRPGVQAGTYHVTVTKQRMTGVRADETVQPGGIRVEWLVPQRYSIPDKSGFQVTVPTEAPAYDFALKLP